MDPKPIVRYSFNESEGDRIEDSSGNNLYIDWKKSPGEFEYEKPEWVDYDNHTALTFKGKELLKRPNHESLNQSQITVMAWVCYKHLDGNYPPNPNDPQVKRFEILEKIDHLD